jgi:hypothetical protein
MKTLLNPANGADIESVYCERGTEIYAETIEKVEGIDVKVKRVTNSSPFILKVGGKITVPGHQALWALKTWPFLQEVGCEKTCDKSCDTSAEVPAVGGEVKSEPIQSQTVVAEGLKEPKEPQEPEDRFADLQIKGFRNLKGAEREEYQTLKAKLGRD